MIGKAGSDEDLLSPFTLDVQVIKGLKAAEKVFGSTKNSKGYTVITGAGVIQGDGINHKTLKDIMDKTLEEGYAANNVVFGMGGALLQKLNRCVAP